ncbi:MAG: hypothetical protein WCO09_01450 [bacterium]
MNNLSDNLINKEQSEMSDKANPVLEEGSLSVDVKPVDLGSLSFFNSDPYFKFVYKKSERLCMAIYLITDFFPSEDPIKDNMRRSGADLLKISLSLITSSSSFRKEILNEIPRLCLEVVSLSKVAANLGMTSLPNHNVLEGEIKNFISVIEDREKPSTTGQGFVLNEGVLGIKTGDVLTSSADATDSDKKIEKSLSSERSVSNKTHNHADENVEIIDNNSDNSLNFVDKKTSQHQTSESFSKTQYNSKSEPKEAGHGGHIKSGVAPKSVMQKNDRQQIILQIIKEIGESSIKDISDNVKDCSEKTIQRELNTLIYDGVIKKIGERRWSKYVLA